MAVYQRDMFTGLAWDYECTRAGLISVLKWHSGDGNWRPAIREVNRVVEKLERWIRNMAPKAQQKDVTATFYFVNVPVGEDDIPVIDEMFRSADTAFSMLNAVLTEGFKVSFSLNSQNNLTVCSLTDRREGSPTIGACLTGGGDGWFESLCVMLYKYTHLLQGDLSNGSRGVGQGRRIM